MHKPQSFRENAMKVSAQDNIHVTVIAHNPVCIDDYRGKTSAEVCRMVNRLSQSLSGLVVFQGNFINPVYPVQKRPIESAGSYS